MAENYNGFLAWRDLLKKYEPVQSGRIHQMLMSLLHPENWTASTFEEDLRDWEKAIIDYEKQSKEQFPPRMKVAVVCRFCPEEFKKMVENAAVSSKSNKDMDKYKAFRQLIDDYLSVIRRFVGPG